MDPTYMNKKIVDLNDMELIGLGFLGENVAPSIQSIVETVRAYPERLGTVTCLMVDCLRRRSQAPTHNADEVPASPISQSQHRSDEDIHTVVAPNLISDYERQFWYHGISGDPPKLMWRSDFETNPFPVRPPGAHFFRIPQKTAHGVFNTALNTVWDTVAPRILESMKANGLIYSALKTVRFSTIVDGEDGEEENFGPVVVWIAVRPGTTDARAVRDATPDVLNILADAGVTDVVVEWYEASVVRLAGPPLMRVDDRTSPRFGLNHPFNTGLGIPIARQSDDDQGTLTFLFREMKTSNGNPSDRILALTNKHVASADWTTCYEFDRANPQYILVCGEHRLARAVVEIEDTISNGLDDAAVLTKESEEEEEDMENSTALRRKNSAFDYKNEDNATLQTFLTQVNANWQDTISRRLGVVDWAPEISVSVDHHHYTRDIATFAVDGAKLENFKRNIIDLGNQYNASQLTKLFWPIDAVRKGRRIPVNLQLPVRRALTRPLVLTPDTEDKNGEPLYIVAKYGNSTKLTLGRYTEMEAYICTDIGLESKEVAVYNYSQALGDFSHKGDSGSLIFTGDGDGLAILHSGMPRGMHNHVTYGTPIWWVIDQVLARYPYAEFYGITVENPNVPQATHGES